MIKYMERVFIVLTVMDIIFSEMFFQKSIIEKERDRYEQNLRIQKLEDI